MSESKKEHQRSIRMTEEVRAYVGKQPGTGFNQQFENMVLYCMKKEPELKKKITVHEKRLEALQNQINEAQSMLRDIDILKSQLSAILHNATKITSRIEEEKDKSQIKIEEYLAQ